MTLAVAREMAAEMAVVNKLSAMTRPFMFLGEREYARPKAVMFMKHSERAVTMVGTAYTHRLIGATRALPSASSQVEAMLPQGDCL